MFSLIWISLQCDMILQKLFSNADLAFEKQMLKSVVLYISIVKWWYIFKGLFDE